MTLAAAYRVGKTPVLLSDFLTSGQVRNGKHAEIPTRVDLTEPRPLDWQIEVKGMVRKTVKICDNLAVAIAGSILGAMVVTNKLLEQFADQCPDRIEFAEYLAGIDDAKPIATEVTLVGWLVEDEEPHSFRWTSTSPEELDWGEDYLTGSGTALFQQLAWRKDQRDWQLTDSFDHARRYVWQQVANMLVNEITNGATVQNLFGAGYDITIWDGKRFRSGNDLTFLFISLDWLQSKVKNINDLSPTLIRYAEIEDCVVVRSLLGPQIAAQADKHERVAIIAPLSVNATTHRFAGSWNWEEIDHFTDPVFIVVIGVGPNGTPEHWSGSARGNDAKAFMLKRNEVNGKVQFWLPQVVMDGVRAAAEQQFTRTLPQIL